MGPIVDVTGDELTALLCMLAELHEAGGTVYNLAVCVDDGLKLKINAGIWSPPVGTVRVV